MELLESLLDFVFAFAGLFYDCFVILFVVLYVFNKNVRDAFTMLIATMAQALHIHIYRDKEGWVEHDWGGLRVYRRVRTCRCDAVKTYIKGEL